MRRILATGLLVLATGAGISQLPHSAEATSHPTFQTVQKSEVLVSPKCIDISQTTKTYYHWSKTAYVKYPKVKTTVTTSRTCHK